jgi:hypothetical protein
MNHDLHTIRNAFKKGDKVKVTKKLSFSSEWLDGKICTVKSSSALHVTLEEESTIFPNKPNYVGGVWKDEIKLIE